MSLSRLGARTVPPSPVERYLVLVPPGGAEGEEETLAAPTPPASTLPPHYQRLSACLPRSPLLLSSSSSSYSYSSLSFSSSALPITVRPSTTQNESESESESESECESEKEEGEEEVVGHRADPPLVATSADESASGGAAVTTVVWRPDHEVELCTECGARFTLILRKVPTPFHFSPSLSPVADDGDWIPCAHSCMHLILCGLGQHHCRGCGGAAPHVSIERSKSVHALTLSRDRDLLRPVFRTPEAAVGQF